jgi:hypothetical protein
MRDVWVKIGGTRMKADEVEFNLVTDCSCDEVDITSFGFAVQKRTLPVRDPHCPQHGVNKVYANADEIILTATPDDSPEVLCCRCEKITPLRTSTWEEHDYRYAGWWCHGCRVDAGFDVEKKPLVDPAYPYWHPLVPGTSPGDASSEGSPENG